MPSATYRLFAQAMRERKQIVCTYHARPREVCPIILGHKKGQEKALTFQFAGLTSQGKLPPAGVWRCLTLSEVSDVNLRKGPWYSGDSHSQRQECVDEVDLDVNPKSPYSPKRRLPLKRNRGSP